MNRKVLVVGGAGYIGSHMVLALQDAGYHVLVFDNLSRGHADAISGAELVLGDLRNPSDLERCLAGHEIGVVMHFAALAYVGESVSDPELYYENNVIGTLNLLSSMRRHGINRFVFSSTCATYGEPNHVPISESHQQIPINPYGRTKLIIENVLREYADAYDVRSVSLRYFNAAGSDLRLRAGERHNPETHLIPLVLSEALRIKSGGDPAESELKIFGDDFPTPDGSCIRDYIHVSDLCQAHLSAVKALLNDEIGSAEAFNLANGHGFSVFDIIEVCRQITGQDIQYQIVSRRAGDPAKLVGDARKASLRFEWSPQYTDLKDIIQTAWNWMTRPGSFRGCDT